VGQYQKGKTIWILLKQARDSEWQWHQLGHMQVCTSIRTDNHVVKTRMFFTGRMPFLPPNQRRQSTEGSNNNLLINNNLFYTLRHARRPSCQFHDLTSFFLVMIFRYSNFYFNIKHVNVFVPMT